MTQLREQGKNASAPATKRGKLIVLCGIDGAGKTTQEELLSDALQKAGEKVCCTKQPTDWYRNHPEVRRFLDTGDTSLRPETIALLAAADRMIHLDSFVQPLLAQGTHVISNRYVYSSYGYFKARGVDRSFVVEINKNVPVPDLGVLLWIPPDETVERVRRRGHGTKFEERDAAYLGRVQDELVAHWPPMFLTLDATLPREQLAERILEYVLAGIAS